jgi:hypothetical protein
MVVSLTGLGSENEYAGEGQQKLQMTDPSSRQRGCYIRTMTVGVQLRKKHIVAMSLKESWRQEKLIGGKQSVVK